MEYQPEEIRVSAVAIKFDPLNIEFARLQPQMPPLMGLISVQPAPARFSTSSPKLRRWSFAPGLFMVSPFRSRLYC
jgi:hypothetical protein